MSWRFPRTILLTLRERGKGCISDGLRHQHPVTMNYALETVLHFNSLRIFNLIHPYIPCHHPSNEHVVFMLLYDNLSSMVRLLTPYLTTRQMFQCFFRAMKKPHIQVAQNVYTRFVSRHANLACEKLFEPAIMNNMREVRRFLAEECATVGVVTSYLLRVVISTSSRPSTYNPHDVIEVVELLCQSGVLVDEADRDSYTALHLLALNGQRSMPAESRALWAGTHVECVRAVLSAGQRSIRLRSMGERHCGMR